MLLFTWLSVKAFLWRAWQTYMRRTIRWIRVNSLQYTKNSSGCMKGELFSLAHSSILSVLGNCLTYSLVCACNIWCVKSYSSDKIKCQEASRKLVDLHLQEKDYLQVCTKISSNLEVRFGDRIPLWFLSWFCCHFNYLNQVTLVNCSIL